MNLTPLTYARTLYECVINILRHIWNDLHYFCEQNCWFWVHYGMKWGIGQFELRNKELHQIRSIPKPAWFVAETVTTDGHQNPANSIASLIHQTSAKLKPNTVLILPSGTLTNWKKPESKAKCKKVLKSEHTFSVLLYKFFITIVAVSAGGGNNIFVIINTLLALFWH